MLLCWKGVHFLRSNSASHVSKAMIPIEDSNPQTDKPSALISDVVVKIPVLVMLMRLGVQRRGVIYHTEQQEKWLNTWFR